MKYFNTQRICTHIYFCNKAQARQAKAKESASQRAWTPYQTGQTEPLNQSHEYEGRKDGQLITAGNCDAVF